MVVIQEESESEDDLDYIASLNVKSEENNKGVFEDFEEDLRESEGGKLRRCQSDSIGDRTDRSRKESFNAGQRNSVVLGLKPEVVELLSKFNEVDLTRIIQDDED